MSYSELVFSGGPLGAPAPQNCPQQQHRVGGTEYALIMPQTSKHHQLQNAATANLPNQANKQATILPRPRRPEEVVFHISLGNKFNIRKCYQSKKQVDSTSNSMRESADLKTKTSSCVIINGQQVMKEMPGSCSSTRRLMQGTDEMAGPCSSRHPEQTSRHPDEMSGPCSSLSQDTHPTMDSTIGSTFDPAGNQFFTLPTSSRSSLT